MLAPKRIRRKVQRSSMKGKAKGYTQLNHGRTASRLSRLTGLPTARSRPLVSL